MNKFLALIMTMTMTMTMTLLSSVVYADGNASPQGSKISCMTTQYFDRMTALEGQQAELKRSARDTNLTDEKRNEFIIQFFDVSNEIGELSAKWDLALTDYRANGSFIFFPSELRRACGL